MEQWNKIYKEGSEKYTYYNFLEPHKDMPMICNFFEKRGIRKVLDLGCGAGRNLIYLAKKGFDVYGIDISPEGITVIQKILKNEKLTSSLKIGDVFKRLPYPDDMFDAVVSVQVLQHGTEEKIKKAISEINRILRPGGIIFITLCGRYTKGKIRKILVQTAKKIAQNTFVPTQGEEMGLTHFIYNKRLIFEHYNNFRILKLWKDEKDYYCFIGESRKKDGSQEKICSA